MHASNKKIIIRLIEQDFKMIGLSNRLDAVGFAADFPNVSYEIFDLMGISDEVQAGELDNQYWQWALASTSFTHGLEKYLEWVYEQLMANVK